MVHPDSKHPFRHTGERFWDLLASGRQRAGLPYLLGQLVYCASIPCWCYHAVDVYLVVQSTEREVCPYSLWSSNCCNRSGWHGAGSHEHATTRYVALCVLIGGSFVASPLTIARLSGNRVEPGKRSIVLRIKWNRKFERCLCLVTLRTPVRSRLCDSIAHHISIGLDIVSRLRIAQSTIDAREQTQTAHCLSLAKRSYSCRIIVRPWATREPRIVWQVCRKRRGRKREKTKAGRGTDHFLVSIVTLSSSFSRPE